MRFYQADTWIVTCFSITLSIQADAYQVDFIKSNDGMDNMMRNIGHATFDGKERPLCKSPEPADSQEEFPVWEQAIGNFTVIFFILSNQHKHFVWYNSTINSYGNSFDYSFDYIYIQILCLYNL